MNRLAVLVGPARRCTLQKEKKRADGWPADRAGLRGGSSCAASHTAWQPPTGSLAHGIKVALAEGMGEQHWHWQPQRCRWRGCRRCCVPGHTQASECQGRQEPYPDVLGGLRARSVQLSAAAALGRLAGFSDDLATEVVRLGILPHLVRPIPYSLFPWLPKCSPSKPGEAVCRNVTRQSLPGSSRQRAWSRLTQQQRSARAIAKHTSTTRQQS